MDHAVSQEGDVTWSSQRSPFRPSMIFISSGNPARILHLAASFTLVALYRGSGCSRNTEREVKLYDNMRLDLETGVYLTCLAVKSGRCAAAAK